MKILFFLLTNFIYLNLWAQFVHPAFLQPSIVQSVTGQFGGRGVLDGTGTSARFNYISGIVLDSYSGAFYITEYQDIRKVTSGGVVTFLAGSNQAVTGLTNGTGTSARFNNPRAIATDTSGNLYVADSNNNCIRKVTSAGVVSVFAGSTSGVFGTADGTGTAARFRKPTAIIRDSLGYFYIADSVNNTIRKMDTAGVVTTYAGVAGTSGANNGASSTATFNEPFSLAIDGSNNLYVGENTGQTIRKITTAGIVSTVAGVAASAGAVDGASSTAKFNGPVGMVVDQTNTYLYVADFLNNAIRRVTLSDGSVSTYAGTMGIPGSSDGLASSALFYYPAGITVDGSNNLYVTDSANQSIRQIQNGTSIVSLFAGLDLRYGASDGIGSAATFMGPTGLETDSSGNFYITDSNNHILRQVTSAGVVTTVAGVSGTLGYLNGSGTSAKFNFPKGIAKDVSGDFYIADYGGNSIRKVTLSGYNVTRLAGSTLGVSGTTDATGTSARFMSPYGIAISGAGDLYVTDSGNHTIRKVTTAGVVTTFAGIAGSNGIVNGVSSTAKFDSPQGIAIDGSNNLYVADSNNHVIRKITSAGVVSTFAGIAGTSGMIDGASSTATFSSPTDIYYDGSQNLYVGQTGGIRKVNISTGTVVTVVGSPNQWGVSLSPLPASSKAPTGMRVYNGYLYFIDVNGLLKVLKP